MWRWRQGFWNFFMEFKFRHAKPMVIPAPMVQIRPIVPVPFENQFPRIPIAGIMVADHVPSDESQLPAQIFCRLQLALDRTFSPMQHGLPPIDANPEAALADAYPASHRRSFPAPTRPTGFDPVVDLGRLAVDGPYSSYVTRSDSGIYQWDVSALEGFQVHPGLRSPAAVVEFTLDAPSRSLRATRIDTELGSCTPGDRDWELAQRLALCGVSTHLSLIRHFNWLHLMSGGPLSFTTRNCLLATHPVRRLLQPHVYATHSSNQMVTLDQMAPGGDFENIFSFTHAGMCELFESTCADSDLRRFNPEVDAQLRGLDAGELDLPAHENFLGLYGVIRAHVERYLGLYFDSDEAIAADEQLAAWVECLDAYVPHGVPELAGAPLTLSGASQLLATLIYFTTVEHEALGSGVWNYQLWPDVQPPRVYASGQRLPLDVYARLVNANFTLNVRRTPLMSDFSSLALDARGAHAFGVFREDLTRLQGAMDAAPTTGWRIEPRMLKANINA
jgi:arachidonate 15-lipoxygenase